jgi:hypothetical protein
VAHFWPFLVVTPDDPAGLSTIDHTKNDLTRRWLRKSGASLQIRARHGSVGDFVRTRG